MSGVLSETDKCAAIIVDPLHFRRAGIFSLLQTWANSIGLTIAAVSPDAIPAPGPGCKFKLAVLNVGGVRLEEPTSQELIKTVIGALPETPIVIVSDRDDADQVVAAFQAGARGFVPTNIDPEVALLAFSFIMAGGSFFPPAALRKPCHPDGSLSEAGSGKTNRAGETKAHGLLTLRQQEVLDLLREGKANKVIARQLSMRESTVKVHVRQIMRKLGASNRTQAALSAMVYGETWHHGEADADPHDPAAAAAPLPTMPAPSTAASVPSPFGRRPGSSGSVALS